MEHAQSYLDTLLDGIEWTSGQPDDIHRHVNISYPQDDEVAVTLDREARERAGGERPEPSFPLPQDSCS